MQDHPLPVRLFEYSNSTNLGDEIQTLAVRQHLDGIDGYVDRDHPPRSDSPYAVVMQGWFTKNPKVFPLPPEIRPIWVGFHLGLHAAHVLDDEIVRGWLGQWGTIGCRDNATADLLRGHGIQADVSGCLTTTFPRRDREPTDGRVFLVNTAGVPLPDHLRARSSVRVTQEGAPWWPHEAKRMLAEALLRTYRDQASLVVTTRLHCALPCVAMGIPVIFVGDPDDTRLDPIRTLAEYIPFPNRLRNETPRARAERKWLWAEDLRHREWKGAAPNIEDAKARLSARLREAVAAATA